MVRRSARSVVSRLARPFRTRRTVAGIDPNTTDVRLLHSHIQHLETEYHAASHVRDRIVELGLEGALSEAPEDWAPFLKFAPPGHFYSPIPRMSDVDRRAAEIFDRS